MLQDQEFRTAHKTLPIALGIDINDHHFLGAHHHLNHSLLTGATDY